MAKFLNFEDDKKKIYLKINDQESCLTLKFEVDMVFFSDNISWT